MRGGDIQEVEHLGTQKTLGNAMPSGGIGGNYDVGACGFEMLLRALLAGTGDDFETWIQTAGREHYINVGRVGSGGGNQAQSMIDTGISQHSFAGGIASEDQPLRLKLRRAFLIGINNDKGARFGRKFQRDAGAHTSGAAYDVMVFQARDF